MAGGFIFRASNLWTDCEACSLRVNLSRAGACTKCRRVLCHTHLHGSFVRRLLVDVGFADLVCVECRSKEAS